MAQRVIMPKQGLQMIEGTIIEWHVTEGAEVLEGKPLFTMETDKLTITIDAMTSGTLLKIVASAGTTVPITGLIAIVGKPGEDISALLAETASSAAAPAAAVSGDFTLAAKSVRSAETASGMAAGKTPGERVFISPRAKTRAKELGIKWHGIRGSGIDGMIIEKDILSVSCRAVKATPLAKKTAAIAGVDPADISGTGPRGKVTRADVLAIENLHRGQPKPGFSSGSGSRASQSERKILPMSGMRKIIAERMKQSQNENAQACHRISVRMDEAFRLREKMEKSVSYNDIIAMATVRALMDFPVINAELRPEGIWQKNFVNLGIAVAIEGGLIVPVVKDAHLLSLTELAASIKDLGGKARSGTLRPDDYSGGSFTMSNLGMFGLEEFTAIINPPEAGILAVGKIEDTPVAVNTKDGNKTVEIHPVMKLTLSYDHRIVDGAPAALFLSRIKEYLENKLEE